jgi:hypothetical protein
VPFLAQMQVQRLRNFTMSQCIVNAIMHNGNVASVQGSGAKAAIARHPRSCRVTRHPLPLESLDVVSTLAQDWPRLPPPSVILGSALASTLLGVAQHPFSWLPCVLRGRVPSVLQILQRQGGHGRMVMLNVTHSVAGARHDQD